MLRSRPLPGAVREWTAHDVTLNRRSELEAKKAAATVLRIARECGWKRTGDMNRRDAVVWLRDFIREGGAGAAKTAHNHRSRLRSFAAYLAETDDGPAAIFDGIRLPAARTAKGASAFTWTEISALVERARQCEQTSGRAGKYGPMRSTFYGFLALTGLRSQEARSQRWGDVNLERRTMTVTADKSRRRDPVRFNAECVALLREWRKWSRGEKLFPHAPSHHTLVADMRECGIPSTPEGRRGQWHRFRKGLCSELAVQGVDLEQRRRAMRHKDTRITADLYTDAEIVDNSSASRKAVESIPSLKKMPSGAHVRLTKPPERADTHTAKAMATNTTNIVTEKNRACPRWPGLSNRSDRSERGSSLSQRGGVQFNGAGGNRTPGAGIAAILADLLRAQIRAFQELSAALN